MLQGTLDVFSLDEVLGLLSGANKDGVLNITGDRGVGSVSISDGQLVAGSVSSAPEAATLSDVVFELLRYDEGSFSFDGSAEAVGEPHELDAVMAEAHGRLDEWKSIEAVVPSFDHHVSLSAKLSTSQVTLSESEWATIVAVGEGAAAGVVAQRLGLGEFDGSKRIKSLIERSLASLDDGAPAAAAEAPAPIVAVEDTPVSPAPVFETPAPAPASFADVAAPTEPGTTGVASSFALDAVAPEAPAFEDSAVDAFVDDSLVADAEIPPMPEAPSFESADVFDAEIPPMPEAPSFESADVFDAEIPSMPEAPAASTEFVSEVFDAPIPSAPEVAPSAFGGLDPIDGGDMFETPVRGGVRSTDVFGSDGFDAGDLSTDTEMDAPMPPPPVGAPNNAIPSFAPPEGFDAAAFSGADDLPLSGDEVAEAAEEVAPQEKGGSLLMRYLKSNG